MLPLSSTDNSILLAASPGNTVAQQLAAALNQRGYPASILTSIAAARVSSAEGQGCVVVLAGGESDDPIVQAAIEAGASILIPIVAPSQSVPAGAWTAPAIVYRGFMGEVITALLAAIAHPLPPAEVPPHVPVAPESDPVLMAAKAAQEKKEQQTAKRKRTQRIILIARLIILLIYIPLGIWQIHTVTSLHYNPPHSVPASRAYFVNVPGPCNGTTNEWYQSDSKDTYTCQTNGLVMNRNDDQYVDDMWLSFDYQDHTAPAAYRVEVHADLSTDACAGMSVHNADNSFGAQNFFACASSEWFVSRWKDNGDFDKVLAGGFLPHAALQVDLRVDVIGSAMTFYVDGKPIDTIIDSTFSTTNSLALDITSDASTAVTATVTFSQFRYTPLFYSDQQIQSVLATAQAQQQQELRQGYHAAVPGYGCDPRGRAWWSPASFSDDSTRFHCESHGFAMHRGAQAQSLAEEYFYWHNGLFPRDYRTSVTIDLRHSNGGCAGLLTRGRDYAGYSYQICQDGTWSFHYYFASDGHSALVASGKIPAKPIYQMSVTDLGSLHTLTIDGKKITTQQDGDFTDTEFLALVVANTYGRDSDVLFSDFSYAPLFAQTS